MDPKLLHDLLAIVKGFRNGLVYGAKVRFPHALVMTFLFQSGSYAMIDYEFVDIDPACLVG